MQRRREMYMATADRISDRDDKVDGECTKKNTVNQEE